MPTHQAYTANRGIGKRSTRCRHSKVRSSSPFQVISYCFFILAIFFITKSNPLFLRIALHFAYLFFALSCSPHPRLTTEDDRFGNRIAADSVVAMQTAANFAACEQPGNDVASYRKRASAYRCEDRPSCSEWQAQYESHSREPDSIRVPCPSFCRIQNLVSFRRIDSTFQASASDHFP